MSRVIIYHASCQDGWCAAWILARCFPGSTTIPAQYGQEPPPEIEGRDVIVVDFSYPRDVMERMNQSAKSLLVMDHHKTAKAQCDGLAYCVFSDTLSGAMMAWHYVKQNGQLYRVDLSRDVINGMEHLARYTQDRDLWKFEMHQSREMNAAIRSYRFDLATWDSLSIRISVDPYGLIVEGEAIIRYQVQLIEEHLRHAGEITIGGYRVKATQCVSSTLTSEVAGRLAEQGPFGAVYFINTDGDLVFSLRSRDESVDVSEIAKLYGGGGHHNAAGFRVPWCSLDVIVPGDVVVS